MPGLANSSVAWGDMNNNGKPDLVLTGTDSAFTPRARVRRNEGNNIFTNATAGLPGLPPTSSGSSVWGDYDNDGYWDFLLTGFDAGNNPFGQLDQNHTTLENNVKPLISDPQRLDDSDFQFGFNGKTGQPYLTWNSTNLTDWNPIGAAREASPGHFCFRDNDAGSHAKRFYKTSSP